MILGFAWDEEEPKLLIVHTQPVLSQDTKTNYLVCLWVSPDKGILLHEVGLRIFVVGSLNVFLENRNTWTAEAAHRVLCA